MTSAEMKKLLIALAIVGVLWWAFPPFHVRSLKAIRAAQSDKKFDPAEFAARFWTEKLLPSAEKAAEAAEVLEKIAADPKTVRERFGRTVGIGSSYFLFLRGSGRVVSADENAIALSLSPAGSEAHIFIERGFVFGNAVRDATGLIQPSAYPNAQEFNDISAALNSIVETNVLPRLQQFAKAGTRIQFAGCAEISDEDLDLHPLKLVPVLVKAE